MKKIILLLIPLLLSARLIHAQNPSGYWTNGLGFTVMLHPSSPNYVIATNPWYTFVSLSADYALILTNGQINEATNTSSWLGDSSYYGFGLNAAGTAPEMMMVGPVELPGYDYSFARFTPDVYGGLTNFSYETYTLDSYCYKGIYDYYEIGEAFIGSVIAPTNLSGITLEISTTEGSWLHSNFAAQDHCLLTFNADSVGAGTTNIHGFKMPVRRGTYTATGYPGESSLQNFAAGTWVAQQLNRTTYRIYFTETDGSQVFENYVMVLSFANGSRCWVENYGQIYQTFEHGLANIVEVPPAASVAPTKATVTLSPTNQIVMLHSNVTLRVAATSTATVLYQWCKGGVAIPNATNATFTITNASVFDAGQYYAVISTVVFGQYIYVYVPYAGGIERSADASVTVVVPESAKPFFTAVPTNSVVWWGSNIVLSAAITGEPAIICQWFKNTNAILNATNTTLVISNATSTNAGTVYLHVSNFYGSTNSPSVTLVVTGAPPQIISGLTNIVAKYGTQVSLAVIATGPELKYQWYQGNTKLTNFIRNSMGTQVLGNTTYSVKIFNGWGTNQSTAKISLLLPTASLQLVKSGANQILLVSGTTSDVWKIQSSTNLLTWTTIQTNTIGTNGNMTFTITNHQPRQFFRAAQ